MHRFPLIINAKSELILFPGKPETETETETETESSLSSFQRRLTDGFSSDSKKVSYFLIFNLMYTIL
jgi:hypothetical protein